MKSCIKNLIVLSVFNSFYYFETYSMEPLSPKENCGNNQNGSISQVGSGHKEKIINREEGSERIIQLASNHIKNLLAWSKEKNRKLSSLHEFFLGSKETKKGLAYQRFLTVKITDPIDREEIGRLRDSPLTAPLHITPVHGSWHQKFFSYYSVILKKNIKNLKIGETYFIETPDKISCCIVDIIPRERWAIAGYIPENLTTRHETTYALEAASFQKLGTFYPHSNPEHRKRFENLVNKKGRIAAVTFILNTSIDGNPIDLTQYYTWVERDNKSPNGLSIENIDNIALYSNVIARHTGKYDIKPLMNRAANLWEKAILSGPINPDVFIENLSEYAYLMTHALPFCLGSSDIIEWSIKAICSYHNLRFFYDGVLEEDAILNPYPKVFLEHFKNHLTFTEKNPVLPKPANPLTLGKPPVREDSLQASQENEKPECKKNNKKRSKKRDNTLPSVITPSSQIVSSPTIAPANLSLESTISPSRTHLDPPLTSSLSDDPSSFSIETKKDNEKKKPKRTLHIKITDKTREVLEKLRLKKEERGKKKQKSTIEGKERGKSPESTSLTDSFLDKTHFSITDSESRSHVSHISASESFLEQENGITTQTKEIYPELHRFLAKFYKRGGYSLGQLNFRNSNLIRSTLQRLKSLHIIDGEVRSHKISVNKIDAPEIKFTAHTTHGSGNHSKWYHNPEVVLSYMTFLANCDPLIRNYCQALFGENCFPREADDTFGNTSRPD